MGAVEAAQGMRMSKWGVWTRVDYLDSWERMTEFGEELVFDSKAEADKFVKKMQDMDSPFQYEVRKL